MILGPRAVKDIIYLYLPDAMADWETGYLLQGLTMQNMLPAPRYHLKTVGASTAPVRTLGGMTVVPDCAISQVQKEKIAALLLPGGDSWSAPEQRAVLELAACLLEQGTLVAAICGATLPLAELGLLDSRPHTSNSLYFLSGLAKNYRGSAFYRDELAVADGNLITASSAGGLLWARKILERLELYSARTVEAWYQYYATGDAKYYMELIESFAQ